MFLFQTFRTYLDNLRVLAAEEPAEGRDDSLLDEIGDLLLASGNREVGDGPSGLFLSLELALEKKNIFFSDWEKGRVTCFRNLPWTSAG